MLLYRPKGAGAFSLSPQMAQQIVHIAIQSSPGMEEPPMKSLPLKLFCAIAFLVLFQSLYLVSVEAAPTGKIVFTSTRDGNREIYVMNPDGSDQVNLTQHHSDDF